MAGVDDGQPPSAQTQEPNAVPVALHWRVPSLLSAQRQNTKAFGVQPGEADEDASGVLGSVEGGGESVPCPVFSPDVLLGS